MLNRILPIDEFLPDLLSAIKEHTLLLVIGDTGCGKSTRLPKTIYEAFDPGMQIVVTQPRRVAALSLADRVSAELGVQVGREVGYSIRFDDKTSIDTRLRYVTDGVLLRETISDPLLMKYDVIILDEAHERSLETDILFGLLKQCHSVRSTKPLYLVIMSATLHVEKFSSYFNNCLFFNIVGKTFPVEILYEKEIKSMISAKSSYVARALETILYIHEKDNSPNDIGDILVFLTGYQEIEEACFKLSELYYSQVQKSSAIKMDILPLYSSLDIQSQRKVFESAPKGHRKVVISTNIAATSVTIENIKYVVDCGFVKQKVYDPSTGMDSLLVVPVSQSAATQRSGRAGRTGPGMSFRLYSRQCYETEFDEDTIPEIQRTSLAGSVLQLLKLGIEDVLSFDFMDPPDENCLRMSLQQLYLLDAITPEGRLTPTGEKMSRFPISPFLARVLIFATEQSNSSFSLILQIITIVAMLSSEEVWIKPRRKEDEAKFHSKRLEFLHPLGDHLTLLNVYRAWECSKHSQNWARDHFIHFRSLQAAKFIRNQLLDLIFKKKELESNDLEIKEISVPDSILRPFSVAYFMNCARRRPSSFTYCHVVTNMEDSSFGVSFSSKSQFSKTKTFNFLPCEAFRNSCHLQALFLHPMCSLRELYSQLPLIENPADCVIYTEILSTQKSFMRQASIIKYEWIIESLKKLKHVGELPCLKLNNEAINDGVQESKIIDNCNHERKRQTEVTSDSESKADEAKVRYLERKMKKAKVYSSH